MAAVHRRCSPIARATAAVLEDRSWKTGRKVDGQTVFLPVVMVGYGGTADGKRRPAGLADDTKHCRRSAMRGVRELEQAGLVKVGGETIERKAYRGRRSWFQRIGGRREDGKGQANEYGPGQALGTATARPRPGPPPASMPEDEMTPDDLRAAAENRRRLAGLMLEAAEKMEARAGP